MSMDLDLKQNLLSEVPYILAEHFSSIKERSRQGQAFMEQSKAEVEPGLQPLLESSIHALFMEEPEFSVFMNSAYRISYEQGKSAVQVLDQALPLMLDYSKDLHLTIYHRISAVLEKSAKPKEQYKRYLDRLAEINWTLFLGFVQGFIAVKDKQIDYLHSQKVSVMGQMAAGMAHEIRNPLASVKGFAQLVKHKLQHPDVNIREVMDYLDVCIEEVNSINSLISDFLLLSRKNEQNRLLKTTVNLKEVIHRVCSLTNPLLIGKDIRFRVNLTEEEVQVYGVASQLEQVFLNVMKNSLDSLSKGGELEVSLQTKPGTKEAVVSIADNGCGIPANALERIFDPFFTTKETGTGIGLSVCKQIMEDHQGEITVQSEETRGTVVRMVLEIREP